MLHRIDGPIGLYRGQGPELDQLCFDLNRDYGTATVIQSKWTFERLVEMGFNPVRPTLVHNAVDSEIFNSVGRIPFKNNRKVRLISSSWSDNARKGLDYYMWLDENLDWSCYEYTFVGRITGTFKNIRHIPAVPSEELSRLLKQHDVYITASQNDPCSNALIEALACGLPALYLQSGGHPEIVAFGGLGFSTAEEIPFQLNRLIEEYQLFQNGISISTIDEIATKYLEIIRTLC